MSSGFLAQELGAGPGRGAWGGLGFSWLCLAVDTALPGSLLPPTPQPHCTPTQHLLGGGGV